MIYHLHHSEIDKAKWDETVSNDSTGLPYAYSDFLNVVSPGWEALVSENYAQILALTAKKKFGMAYLAQPHFCQQIGVFGKSSKLINNFIDNIPEYYKLVEINLNCANEYTGKAFRTIPMRNYELSLDNSYDNLVETFSENTNRNIKKANNNGLKFLKDYPKLHLLISSFKKQKNSTLKLSDDYYNTLIDLDNCKSSRFSFKRFGVTSSSGEFIGGAMFLCSNKRIILIFSTVTETGKKYGAMHFLISEVLRLYAGKSIIFDFEGSNDSNLARFYAGFGSTENNYQRILRNNLPKWIKWVKS